MNEIETLQEQRKEAWKSLKSSHVLLVRAHKVCECLERRYNSDKSKYEKIDHALALLDGRAQRVAAATALANSNRKVKPQPQTDLTNEQIIAIAVQLGLVLPEVKEEEE